MLSYLARPKTIFLFKLCACVCVWVAGACREARVRFPWSWSYKHKPPGVDAGNWTQVPLTLDHFFIPHLHGPLLIVTVIVNSNSNSRAIWPVFLPESMAFVHVKLVLLVLKSKTDGSVGKVPTPQAWISDYPSTVRLTQEDPGDMLANYQSLGSGFSKRPCLKKTRQRTKEENIHHQPPTSTWACTGMHRCTHATNVRSHFINVRRLCF